MDVLIVLAHKGFFVLFFFLQVEKVKPEEPSAANQTLKTDDMMNSDPA